MRQQLFFRAMVFPRDGQWHAECLDLSLVVSRPTPEAAINELQQQIDLHVSTVMEEGLSHELLRRPSPWQHWLRYWRMAVGTWFHHTERPRRTLRLGVPNAAHA